MNEQKMQTSYISDTNEYQEIVTNPKYEIRGQSIINKDVIRVCYMVKKEFLTQTQNCNVILGSFVTAYARLCLYELLEKLQEKVLYFDTGL